MRQNKNCGNCKYWYGHGGDNTGICNFVTPVRGSKRKEIAKVIILPAFEVPYGIDYIFNTMDIFYCNQHEKLGKKKND